MARNVAIKRSKPLVGRVQPRIKPPTPAISSVNSYIQTAEDIGLELMEWQKIAARYIEARGPDKRLLFRECAIIVSRQNGKTTLLLPLIVKRLLEGRRIMHTAQDRSLPREVFDRVADILFADHTRPVPVAERTTDEAALRQRSGGDPPHQRRRSTPSSPRPGAVPAVRPATS